MKNILVVEDSESFRSFISDVLRWRNYHVIEAKDGIEGLQLALEQYPDLILSDIEMPGLNGYELLEELQHNLKTAVIPVILLSDQVTVADRDHALQLGAADYLEKPTLPDQILGKVAACIAHRNPKG